MDHLHSKMFNINLTDFIHLLPNYLCIHMVFLNATMLSHPTIVTFSSKQRISISPMLTLDLLTLYKVEIGLAFLTVGFCHKYLTILVCCLLVLMLSFIFICLLYSISEYFNYSLQ